MLSADPVAAAGCLTVLAQEPAVTIRPATHEDSVQIAAIYAHYVLHTTVTFELDPPAPAEIARRMSDIASRGLPYIVAETRGRVIGYAYATPWRTRPAYRFTVENSIYLLHTETGRGIGAFLLANLIERCRGAGAKQMIAVIADSGANASVRLHVRSGFCHTGVLRRVGFKFDQWLDTTLMQLQL